MGRAGPARQRQVRVGREDLVHDGPALVEAVLSSPHAGEHQLRIGLVVWREATRAHVGDQRLDGVEGVVEVAGIDQEVDGVPDQRPGPVGDLAPGADAGERVLGQGSARLGETAHRPAGGEIALGGADHDVRRQQARRLIQQDGQVLDQHRGARAAHAVGVDRVAPGGFRHDHPPAPGAVRRPARRGGRRSTWGSPPGRGRRVVRGSLCHARGGLVNSAAHRGPAGADSRDPRRQERETPNPWSSSTRRGFRVASGLPRRPRPPRHRGTTGPAGSAVVAAGRESARRAPPGSSLEDPEVRRSGAGPGDNAG